MQPDEDVDGDGDPLLADFDETSEILPSSGVGKFRRNTVAGAVLNGMALGLRDVFDPVVREEAPIVQDAPGEPDEPRHVATHLDPEEPAASTVTVRPWLSSDESPSEPSSNERHDN